MYVPMVLQSLDVLTDDGGTQLTNLLAAAQANQGGMVRLTGHQMCAPLGLLLQTHSIVEGG